MANQAQKKTQQENYQLLVGLFVFIVGASLLSLVLHYLLTGVDVSALRPRSLFAVILGDFMLWFILKSWYSSTAPAPNTTGNSGALSWVPVQMGNVTSTSSLSKDGGLSEWMVDSIYLSLFALLISPFLSDEISNWLWFGIVGIVLALLMYLVVFVKLQAIWSLKNAFTGGNNNASESKSETKKSRVKRLVVR